MLKFLFIFICACSTHAQMDMSSELMLRVMAKLHSEADQLTMSLLNSWKRCDFDKVNFTFLNHFSFDDMNKIIYNMDRAKTEANQHQVNYLIDFLLNRLELWQLGKDKSCEWCMSSSKLNRLEADNLFRKSNASLQQNLVHVQNLMCEIGLPRMAFKPFESAHELKIFLTKSIKVARRKLFLVQTQKFYAFKVWKTNDAKLHTNLVDINSSCLVDVFPTPCVLFYPLVLSDSRWMDLNERIIALEMEQTEGNVYYKGLRLVNHFRYARVRSVKECFEKCLKNEDCAAVTYRPINKDGCHFYRRDEFKVVRDPEWVSASNLNLLLFLHN
ncbi:hypothetical protein BpHYR1_024103 [Brachionus plicatilis]|uniref:Apple domain-containing protein n=1 Tax=Brachionus plicatilis TaxID=10195 RepID=A0A3M7PJ96_BRAPC|nr:hypothetical protein BpHYR1_024103 [Brachionus plicatilis]